MMDIVERLRNANTETVWIEVSQEAADEIERLREALKKIEYHSRDWEVSEIARDALKGDE